MNIKINSVKFSPTKELETFVEGKVKKLGHYYDDIIGAEIFLRVEGSQKLDNKVAEIKLDIPGSEFFAKKQSNSFEQSTDNAIDALRKQIIKHKNKNKRA